MADFVHLPVPPWDIACQTRRLRRIEINPWNPKERSTTAGNKRRFEQVSKTFFKKKQVTTINTSKTGQSRMNQIRSQKNTGCFSFVECFFPDLGVSKIGGKPPQNGWFINNGKAYEQMG